MSNELSRRTWLAAAGAAAAAPLLSGTAPAEETKAGQGFRYCLNTATIRGQKLPVDREAEIAARAGYQGFEPWIDGLEKYVEGGGSLKDLGKRIADHGLKVESAIGFAEWIVDDDARRKKGLENARRAMDMVQQIGGSRIAAPPAGATDQPDLDLYKAAERYRALLELGERMGVTPMVELWGFSKCLHRLGETALVAIESRHPRACVLADVYHVYKGGSSFETLKLLGPPALQVFHMNDYPADPPRAAITDAHRVYPGDGVAPLGQMLRDLLRAGFRGVLSLELFNPDYYKQDALTVARTGLEKMKKVVRAAQE